MEFDYVYADMQVEVSVKGDKDSFYGSLDDTQSKALQQVIYLALKGFVYINCLYQLSLIDPHKYDYLKDEGKEDNG